jgi:hypothetical protein
VSDLGHPCRLTHRVVSHTVPSHTPCRRAHRAVAQACAAWSPGAVVLPAPPGTAAAPRPVRSRVTRRSTHLARSRSPAVLGSHALCRAARRDPAPRGSVSPIRPLAPPRLRVLQRQDMRTGAHVLRFTWNGDGPAPADTPCATAINPPSGPRRPVRHTSRAARSSPRSSPRSRRVVGVAVSRGTGTSAQPASTLEHARPSPCRPDGAHETQGAANRGSTCSKASRGRQLRPHHRWSPTPAAKRRHG